MKILFVLQCSWNANIGIAKVHKHLKPAFEKLGHRVDVLSYDDFYPNGQTKVSKLFSPKIDKLILNRLKMIAKDYDVIDANYECIPYSKVLFNFSGLLIFRSHGIPAVYRKVENSNEYLNMLKKVPSKPIKLKTRIGDIYRFFQKKSNLKKTLDSIKNADLVHCLNPMETDYVSTLNIPQENIILIPNGISDTYIDSAYKDIDIKRDEVVFLASWTPRKGIYDFNDIFRDLTPSRNDLKIKAIGTYFDETYVKSNLDISLFENLTVVPNFTEEELPKHLKSAKVGIFPSYIEGFGLAVVEQLAAGIPVVAYNIPGPREILKDLHESLLVPVGDTSAMAKSILTIFSMSENDYKTLQNKCRERANEYKVSHIANSFLKEYEKGLFGLKGNNE